MSEAGRSRSALLEALRQRDAALAARTAEVAALSAELEATNRGLIALHAELEDAREAEARLAAIVRSSDDAMFSLGADGAVLSWNAGAERLLGYPEAEMVGRPTDVLVPAAARAELEEAVAQVRAGEHAARYDGLRQRRDGTLVEVAVTLSAIRDAGGRITGYSVVLRDLADRRRAEEALAAARAREEVAAERDRIARDLHDLVIQRLFASGMALQVALELGLHDELEQRVERVIGDLDGTISELRSTIFALGQRLQPGESLRAQLLQVASRAADVLGFPPQVHFHGPVDTLVPPAIGEHVLAVAREALSNVARHANASAVEVSLTVGDDAALVVTDDGQGLGDVTRSSGLANMAARARGLGGSFRAAGNPGAGTRLEWRVPLAPAGHPPED